MKRRDRKWRTWETAGLFVVILLGNTLHFVYDWTGQARWAAYVSAVNESTWEHMKLLFVPWLLWTAAQCIGLRSLRPAAPRAVGLLAGMAAVSAIAGAARLKPSATVNKETVFFNMIKSLFEIEWVFVFDGCII